ncbi:hypothetical protein [Sphingopyxis sp.]|uniref:hypothetical protein n=1 Tax=Sphingopyxis sp. TaxID=1908224 RepID=UPI003D0FEB12
MEFHERIARYILWLADRPDLKGHNRTSMRHILRVVADTRHLKEERESNAISGDTKVPDMSERWYSIGTDIDSSIKFHRVRGLSHRTDKEKIWAERCRSDSLTVDQLIRASNALEAIEPVVLRLAT